MQFNVLPLIACLLLAAGLWFFIPGSGGENGNPLGSLFEEEKKYISLGTARAVLWPPIKGNQYPDLDLFNSSREKVYLSEFAGKIILIEMVSMSSPYSIAMAGGNKAGGFKGVEPQEGAYSLREYIPYYAKDISADDPRIQFVKIILFDEEFNPPTTTSIKEWEAHFGLDKYPNIAVLAGAKSMATEEGYNMLHGFHLIDKNFVLRADSAGKDPDDDTFSDVLPMIPELLEENAE